MKIKNCIKAVWEFPQNAVGFIVKRITKATEYTTYKDATVYHWNINGGLSLGKYIFITRKFGEQTEEVIKHEYGHTIQSKYLGWLYLLVIALPSLIWAGCFDWYRIKTGKSYYDFYTESWANKLGGVERCD